MQFHFFTNTDEHRSIGSRLMLGRWIVDQVDLQCRPIGEPDHTFHELRPPPELFGPLPE